ncbi:MAG: hypothetical protein JSW07_20010, partial [bacterium]
NIFAYERDLLKLISQIGNNVKLLNYRKSTKQYFSHAPFICKQCCGEKLFYSINYLTDGTMSTNRYLGTKGYIAKFVNRI